jgi:hypothetical protein
MAAKKTGGIRNRKPAPSSDALTRSDAAIALLSATGVLGSPQKKENERSVLQKELTPMKITADGLLQASPAQSPAKSPVQKKKKSLSLAKKKPNKEKSAKKAKVKKNPAGPEKDPKQMSLFAAFGSKHK